jgi:hypothetical protein
VSEDRFKAEKSAMRLAKDSYGAKAWTSFGDGIDCHRGILLSAMVVPVNLRHGSIFVFYGYPGDDIESLQFFMKYSSASAAAEAIEKRLVGSGIDMDCILLAYCREVGPMFRETEKSKLDMEVFNSIEAEIRKTDEERKKPPMKYSRPYAGNVDDLRGRQWT